jgi:FAD dependent oxidoreductase
VNGSAIAFFLASSGTRDVIIVDAHYPAAGASSQGMGIIRTYHANAPEAALAIASLRIFRNWAEAVGGTCGYHRTRFVWLESPERAVDLIRNARRVSGLGGKISVVGPSELAKLQLHISTAGIGLAAYEPDSGCASGALAAEAPARRAQQTGARLITHEPVLKLRGPRHRPQFDRASLHPPGPPATTGGFSQPCRRRTAPGCSSAWKVSSPRRARPRGCVGGGGARVSSPIKEVALGLELLGCFREQLSGASGSGWP